MAATGFASSSDVRIYNRALCPTEIQTLYSNSSRPAFTRAATIDSKFKMSKGRPGVGLDIITVAGELQILAGTTPTAKRTSLVATDSCDQRLSLARLDVTKEGVTLVVKPTSASYRGRADRMSVARLLVRVGVHDEWHLDFDNAFCHIAFEFGAWPRQPAIVIWSLLLHARLEAVRAVGHSMGCDGVE